MTYDTHHMTFFVAFKETDSIEVKDCPMSRADEVISQLKNEIYDILERYEKEGKIDLYG